ncbi:lipid-A-disaccharide synthase [Neorhodopirellula lusitana]|uniref:lipid-A-disaccharide synthase n=1 Tax=Neorhodopirellula lusitana TaxID=445327 RepID=UPI0038518141
MISVTTQTLFFSVGEPSGDQHAARLISQLRERADRQAGCKQTRSCGLRIRGFGGPEMQQAGCELDLDLTRHAVVGILEVLPKIREFFRFADQAERTFAAGEVDGVVLVDFPGFNWHIAKRAKKYGIPVYYYCPPQLWAWGGWRVKKMKRTVDHVMTVLPVETEFFGRHGIPVTFVGHPFFDAVDKKPLDSDTMRQLQAFSNSGTPSASGLVAAPIKTSTQETSKLEPSRPETLLAKVAAETVEPNASESTRVVAVLPGSRDHEVERNFPVMLETIRRLDRDGVGSRSDASNVRYAVAAYRDRHCLWCRQQLSEADHDLPIDFFVDRTSEIIEAAHCAMMVSGSVSLELMARGTPAAVIYRIGRVLHAVGKRVLKVHSVTLPNLMAGRKVFPEFISVGDVEPAIDFLHETTRAMLCDSFYYNRVRSEMEQLRQAYGQPGASERAAEFLSNQLGLSGFSEKDASGPGVEQTIQRRAA